VTRWLDDEPFPRAEVEFLDGLDEQEGLALRLDPLEQEVRDTLALAHDFDLGQWPVDTPVADEPVSRLWQLAGIAPLSTIDQFVLLRCQSTDELFTRLEEMTRETRQGLSHPEDIAPDSNAPDTDAPDTDALDTDAPDKPTSSDPPDDGPGREPGGEPGQSPPDTSR
jgi:hypothetical protein